MKPLRLKFGVVGINNPAVNFPTADLFLDEQGNGGSHQPTAKKFIRQQNDQANDKAECWF